MISLVGIRRLKAFSQQHNGGVAEMDNDRFQQEDAVTLP